MGDVLFLSSMQDALTLSVSFISYRIGSRLWELSNSLPVFDAENSRHNHNDQDYRRVQDDFCNIAGAKLRGKLMNILGIFLPPLVLS
jgi:hypothetical protein